MQLVQGEIEAFHGPQHDLREQAAPIGVEQPAQRTAEGVVAELPGFGLAQGEALGCEGVDDLPKPVERLALGEKGAEQDAQPGSVA